MSTPSNCVKLMHCNVWGKDPANARLHKIARHRVTPYKVMQSVRLCKLGPPISAWRALVRKDAEDVHGGLIG